MNVPTGKDWPDVASIVRFEDGDPDEDPWVQGRPGREAIEVEPYSHQWPTWYEAQRAKILAAMPRIALGVEHIGSTAVPGLHAKPVIDIDLIVPDPEREADYVPLLESIGFELTVRERSWYQHRMLRRDDPRVNLHIFGPSCPEHVRHILFRDWLRQRPVDRQRYHQAKIRAREAASSVQEYNRRKQDVVLEIYRDIFRSRGWIEGSG
ncbi:MAG: GrpB family protein [Candidatus Kaistia colombiensis]|nr:MAG: GrpB family protein [Kaistia sp.]